MIVALNHKSNLDKEEFKNYMLALKKVNSKHHMILCPNFLNISIFNDENITLGAQNVSQNANGAHTGEISAKQLKSYGVSYCIVGHSERRKDQKETNEEINLKIKELFKENITPILCVGETKEEREKNQVEDIITKELETAFKDLTEEQISKVIIAYEPIWSIGTGIIPTNEQITQVFTMIKNIYTNCKVLYGGSANENNITELKKCAEIDGYLLGGLSLKPDKLQIFVNNM